MMAIPSSDPEEGVCAKGILRGEMARRSVTYAQLAEKLAQIGVEENERNLRNKVSRGNSPQGSCFNA
jgi:hypothetical protein